MRVEFETRVYVTRTNRKGHTQYIIKLPRWVGQKLNLRHKQRVFLIIEPLEGE